MVLSHRERVLQSINHRETDRVPLDLGGPAGRIVDGVPYGYKALCTYLGIDMLHVSYRPYSHVIYPIDERILETFDIDFRHVRVNEPTRELVNGFQDYFGVPWKDTGTHLRPITPPLAEAKKIEDIDLFPAWPDPKNPAFVKGKRDQAKHLREETDYAIMVEGISGLSHRYAWLRGFERWFLDMRIRPEFFTALSERIFNVSLDITLRFLYEVGDFADIFAYGDDMGGQQGPFLSVRDYRMFIKPWFKKYISAVKKAFPHIKFFYHCCGSVDKLIPEFIDCGVDVLNPVQPRARNMEPQRLKETFGNMLCFHGGIDVQQTLPLGDIEEVTEHVRQVVEAYAPGGGYIVGPSHEFHSDISPQKIETVYKAARRYGAYPML